MTQSQTPGLRLVGQIGGATYAVAVREPYAYIGVGPRLVILDVSDPARPTLVGQSVPLNRSVNQLVVQENHAYVAAREAGLHIFDISDAACPIEIGAYEPPRLEREADWVRSGVVGLAVTGGLACVADPVRGLVIVDISDPTCPREISVLAGPEFALNVVVHDALAYVSGRGSGLHIVDVADPARPRAIGRHRTTVFSALVAGRYAYVECEDDLQVLDISDASHPQVVRRFPEPASAVAVRGEHAYVGQYGRTEFAGLRVLVISDDRSELREIGILPAPDWHPVSVVVAESYAYVAAGPAGLRVVDVTDPTRPVEVGHYAIVGEASDVAVHTHRAYVTAEGSGLHIVDVSNPAVPLWVGSCEEIRQAWAVAVDGTHAYVAAVRNGLRIVDVADPSHPSQLASITTPVVHDPFETETWRVAAAQGHVYVAGDVAEETRYPGGYGLRGYTGAYFAILDASDPARPVELTFRPIVGRVRGIVRHNVHVYLLIVTSEGLRLEILDVANPIAPSLVGSYVASAYATALAVDGDRAYIAANSPGWTDGEVRILDVADPTCPQEIGVYTGPKTINAIAATGRYAFFSVLRYGLRMLDVGDSAAPTEVTTFDMAERAWGLAIAGSYLYVASSDAGLLIFEIPGGTQPDPSIAPGEPAAVPRPFLQAFQ
jgi:hypothetical protein